MTVVETAAPAPVGKHTEGFVWSHFAVFSLMHVMAFAAVAVLDVSWQAWLCCFLLYVARMFGITAGYHRYFSHRSYKTSRVGQFLLAYLAQTSGQRGVVWWAAHHRVHHKYTDKPGDLHSPRMFGFMYAHLWWFYYLLKDTDYSKVQDLTKYPELMFLDNYWVLPPLTLAAAVYALLGVEGFLIGFILSTVILWHGTFLINSMAHIVGTRRYETEDDSKNGWFLAIICLGEGWHNNHHYHMTSCRQGFMWWEVDITFYVLKTWEALGLVWDLKEPKEEVVNAYKNKPIGKAEAVKSQ